MITDRRLEEENIEVITKNDGNKSPSMKWKKKCKFQKKYK